MNKIELEGKTYEVLDAANLESIKLITHAKLAGGKVVEVEECPVRGELCCLYSKGIWLRNWQDLGIQPLRLVPKEPVTFEATFALVSGFWTRVTCLDDGIAYQGYEQKPFRCVEIVEGA